jgi:hypothetical protein
MLIAVDTGAPVVLDGSAAHQSFPGDTAVWLIPIGLVNYLSGSPGSFAKRTAAQLFSSRSYRCYTGCFAETLLAADGVLRLRDRQTDQVKNVTNDQLAAAALIQQTDFSPDPKNPARLIGNELVWVEGNLRVTGNARLYGTQLELRDPAGQDDGAPEFLRRGSSAGNLKGGQDLQICIGDSNTGTAGNDRLTIGWLAKAKNPPATTDPSPSTAPDGAIAEVMVVRTDGRAAIGTNAIDFYDPAANILVVATTSDSGITIASDASKTGNVFFADGGSYTGTSTAWKQGFVTYDHHKQQMSFGAGAATVMSLTSAGPAVIGPANPSKFAADADQLIVSGAGSCGITIAAEKGDYANLDFVDTASATNSGYIKYQASKGQMRIGTASADRIFLDDKGHVGIGTDAPGAALNVASGSETLTLDPPNIQAMNGGSPTPLLLQPQGESVGIGLDGTSPDATLHVRTHGNSQSLIVDTVNPDSTAISTLGNKVGIGFAGTPQTILDVRGLAVPVFTVETSNVAMVENQLPIPANVLGLKVGGTFNPIGWNYITFYDNSPSPKNVLGAIEGVSTPDIFNPDGFFNTISFVTYEAADYAECVLRVAGTPKIAPGSVVGVRNGQVSLATAGADAVFVTTDRPSLLGNAAPQADRADYETVSFLGQVPVLTEGPVKPGDLIVATGRGDGTGRGVAADAVTPADLPNIIGQAWASLDAGKTARVNALVGPGVATAAATAALLAAQARKIEQLEKKLARRKPAEPT